MNKDLIATQILYDVGVLLEENYADPTRELFPFLQPAFSLDAHTPFGRRFLNAFEKTDQGQQSLIRAGVVEALRRCGAQWLGLWRSLDVFDLHQAVIPEALSTALKEQLVALTPTEHADQRAIWLDQLLARWQKLKIYPDLPWEYWRDAVADSSPDTLSATLVYLVEGPLRAKVEALDCLSMAKRLVEKWNVDKVLSADLLITLPAIIQHIENAVLPSLVVESAPSTDKDWIPTLEVQQEKECEAMLQIMYDDGFPQTHVAANDERVLAQPHVEEMFEVMAA